MIPVTQTKFSISNSKGERVQYGNCWAAAIASLLELNIYDVPNAEIFMNRDDAFWDNVMTEFLKGLGYELNRDWRLFLLHPEVPVSQVIKDFLKNQTADELKDVFYIAAGPSPRGVIHAVIYQNGKMVHDPHPSRDGILEIYSLEVLEKIEKKEKSSLRHCDDCGSQWDGPERCPDCFPL